MAAGRGKKTAIIVTAAGLAVIAMAGWSLRNLAAEEWQLRRLESKDVEVRSAAAKRLSEMRSARAIPRFFALFEQNRIGEWKVTEILAACGDRSAAPLQAYLDTSPRTGWPSYCSTTSKNLRVARQFLCTTTTDVP